MSRAETLARRGFEIFENHRMLFGFGSLIILTVCSIYFNFVLGKLNSNPNDGTSIAMPLSYSFLDVANLVLLMCLFAGAIRGVVLRAVAWTWAGYLTTLSLFACLSCILALDAINASSGDDFKRQQLQTALNQANASVATWQTNVERTTAYKSRFQGQLDSAIDDRDRLTKEIAKLDAVTPPSQVVFEKMLPLLPAWMDEEMFRTLARLAFGIAMIITPLILTGVLSNVFGRRESEGEQRVGKPQQTDSHSEPLSEPVPVEVDQAIAQVEKAIHARVAGAGRPTATVHRFPEPYPIMDNIYTEQRDNQRPDFGSMMGPTLPEHYQIGRFGSSSAKNSAEVSKKPSLSVVPGGKSSSDDSSIGGDSSSAMPVKAKGSKHKTWHQIVAHIRQCDGILPTYKSLQDRFGCGPNQVRSAFDFLAEQGEIVKVDRKWMKK